MPKISVLMPVYNAEKYIREAIDSIILQTYKDWELIIINDGSTDSSEAVIKSYADTRIKYFQNDSNMGIIETLNRGISLSQSDYIARMDSDDIAMPERFVKQIDFLEQNPYYAMCGTNATVIDQDGVETGKIVNLKKDEYLKINLLFSVPFVHPSIMIRSSILKENLFDSEYKHAEDYDLWCKIADKHKVANLPFLLLKYRWHNTNVSITNLDTQNLVKNRIICRTIKEMGITPTNRDLLIHQVSFQQYNSKSKNKPVPFSNYKELNNWFSKLIDANNICHKYSPDTLSAYLWSRWIVLCLAQKSYRNIFKPKFISININILIRVLNLLLFLSKK